jgi:hypothetical protein
MLSISSLLAKFSRTVNSGGGASMKQFEFLTFKITPQENGKYTDVQLMHLFLQDVRSVLTEIHRGVESIREILVFFVVLTIIALVVELIHVLTR